MKVLAIAPHPDDETLGCGGTLLRHKAENDILAWLIVTDMHQDVGYSEKQKELREREIDKVAKKYLFKTVYRLGFPTTRLDVIPRGKLIEAIGQTFREFLPEIIYLPYVNDVHTDHKIVFEAVTACTKWFRYPSIKRILTYETLSETDFNLDPESLPFRPNVFVNISKTLEEKIEVMQFYKSELGDFPFPRSEKAIRSLAALRGTFSGFHAAEGFMLLKECY